MLAGEVGWTFRVAGMCDSRSSPRSTWIFSSIGYLLFDVSRGLSILPTFCMMAFISFFLGCYPRNSSMAFESNSISSASMRAGFTRFIPSLTPMNWSILCLYWRKPFMTSLFFAFLEAVCSILLSIGKEVVVDRKWFPLDVCAKVWIAWA